MLCCCAVEFGGIIKEKRRGKLTRSALLLHDNAPVCVHKSQKAFAAPRDCVYEELNHPTYSPDLVPGDYFLFRNLKKHFRGRRFPSDNEIKGAVSEWFEEQDKDL